VSKAFERIGCAVGEEIQRELAQLLQHPDRHVRTAVARALGGMMADNVRLCRYRVPVLSRLRRLVYRTGRQIGDWIPWNLRLDAWSPSCYPQQQKFDLNRGE